MSTILSQRDRCTRRKLKAFSVLKSYLGIIEEIIENFPFLIVEFKSVISVCNRIFDMLNCLLVGEGLGNLGLFFLTD